MRACADWVQQAMTDAGLQSTIYPTPGHPIVYGERLVDPALPTVLIYGHYDVQPPDPLNLWTTPAFEPTIRDGRLYARRHGRQGAAVYSSEIDSGVDAGQRRSAVECQGSD